MAVLTLKLGVALCQRVDRLGLRATLARGQPRQGACQLLGSPLRQVGREEALPAKERTNLARPPGLVDGLPDFELVLDREGAPPALGQDLGVRP